MILHCHCGSSLARGYQDPTYNNIFFSMYKERRKVRRYRRRREPEPVTSPTSLVGEPEDLTPSQNSRGAELAWRGLAVEEPRATHGKTVETPRPISGQGSDQPAQGPIKMRKYDFCEDSDSDQTIDGDEHTEPRRPRSSAWPPLPPPRFLRTSVSVAQTCGGSDGPLAASRPNDEHEPLLSPTSVASEPLVPPTARQLRSTKHRCSPP